MGVIAFPAMRSCLCLLALAAMSGQARAAPLVPPPASGFLAPFAIPVAQREERLVPPMPIPHVERKSAPLPRSRPAEAAPRNTAADGPLRNRSDGPSATSSGNSGAALATPTSASGPSRKPPARSRHSRLIIRDRVFFAARRIADDCLMHRRQDTAFCQEGWQSWASVPCFTSTESRRLAKGIATFRRTAFGCTVRRRPGS